MAIIQRDRLTGEAKTIAQQGITAAIAAGNTSIVSLQQQRGLITGQQRQLIAQVNQSLQSVNRNIYKAQRQASARSAQLGFSGDVATARSINDIQDATSVELSNIISQAEQGAIGASAQESAINKAEVQLAASQITDAYADALIDQGIANRDTTKEVTSGIIGAITGAAAGFGLGQGFATFGPKLLSTGGSAISKIVGAGALSAGSLLASNQIGNLANTLAGQDVYDSTYASSLLLPVAGAGAGVGALLGLGDRYLSRESIKTTTLAMKINKTRDAISSKAFKTINLGKAAGQVAKEGKGIVNWVSKTKLGGLLKPSYLSIGAALIGAVIGGLQQGLIKRYDLDINKVIDSDTFKQLENFDIDLQGTLRTAVRGKTR